MSPLDDHPSKTKSIETDLSGVCGVPKARLDLLRRYGVRLRQPRGALFWFQVLIITLSAPHISHTSNCDLALQKPLEGVPHGVRHSI